MRSMKKHFLVLLLVLSLATSFEATKADVLERWHIHVLNGLSNGQVLFAHCQSKDDDLGERSLGVGTEMNWTFRINVWNTTLFWCHLRKPNGQSVSFDAFWVEKASEWLYDRCYGYNCIWTAKDDGIYLRINLGSSDFLLHKWQ